MSWFQKLAEQAGTALKDAGKSLDDALKSAAPASPGGAQQWAAFGDDLVLIASEPDPEPVPADPVGETPVETEEHSQDVLQANEDISEPQEALVSSTAESAETVEPVASTDDTVPGSNASQDSPPQTPRKAPLPDISSLMALYSPGGLQINDHEDQAQVASAQAEEADSPSGDAPPPLEALEESVEPLEPPAAHVEPVSTPEPVEEANSVANPVSPAEPQDERAEELRAAQLQLAQLNRAVDQLSRLVQERDQELEGLRSAGQTQQQQASRLRELEQKHKVETDRLRTELAETQTQLREKREEVRSLASEVEEVRMKMAELNRASIKSKIASNSERSQLEAFKQKQSEQERELVDALEQLEQAGLRLREQDQVNRNQAEELERMRELLALKDQQIEQQMAQIAELSVVREAHKQTLSRSEEQAESVRSQQEEMKKRLLELQARLEAQQRQQEERETEAEARIEQLQQRCRRAETRAEELESELPMATRPLLRQLDTMKQAAKARETAWQHAETLLRDQVRAAAEGQSRAESRSAELQLASHRLQEEAAEAKREVQQLQSQLDHRQELLDAAQARLRELQAAGDRQRMELDRLRLDNDQMRSSAQSNEERINRLRESHQQALDELRETLRSKQLRVEQLEEQLELLGAAAGLRSGQSVPSTPMSTRMSHFGSPPEHMHSKQASMDGSSQSQGLGGSQSGFMPQSQEQILQRAIAGGNPLSPSLGRDWASDLGGLGFGQALARQTVGSQQHRRALLQDLEAERDTLAQQVVELNARVQHQQQLLHKFARQSEEFKKLRQRHFAALQLLVEREEELAQLRAHLGIAQPAPTAPTISAEAAAEQLSEAANTHDKAVGDEGSQSATTADSSRAAEVQAAGDN